MKKRNVFLSNESILNRIIAYRVKQAKKNHDNVIVSNYCKNQKPNNDYQAGDEDIYKILPSRRSWVKIGQKKRNNSKGSYCPMDSVKLNTLRLQNTIKRDKKYNRKTVYLKELNNYIKELRKHVLSDSYTIQSPKIIPAIKDVKEKVLRPLCSYNLEDNIILQEVSAFLTKKFDKLFCDCSFAFRAKNKDNHIPTHHDTIKKILEYRENHKNEQIYIAECDLQKFFDTINHDIVKKDFEKALVSKGVHFTERQKKVVSRIFYQYLDSYDFQSLVYAKNIDIKFLKDHKVEKYKFKWIKQENLKERYREEYLNEKIGVPQGGALSGLIANLIQNKVDQAVYTLKDKNLLYIRYCDDMIMLHTNKEKLQEAFTVYQNQISKNKLFIHDPVDITKYNKKFYDVKSKNPYPWGPVADGQVPWISFVGYQISYNEEVRVRRSSLKKEQTKQYKIVFDAIEKIKKNGIKRSVSEIEKSVQHRLQGMSVGRIHLYNTKSRQSLCWVNGFASLNDNHYSRIQMKRLDKSRRKAFHVLCNSLEPFREPFSDKGANVKSEGKGIRQIIYAGKPYSYYNWLINKKDD